jgi:hypothetical protein
VFSGPGENYYATDTLAQGEIVNVYRENPGGWLGIRPPQDSFSWVFARHVKRLENGLAEVEKNDVPSRIGSRLSDQRNAVQIRLKKGEVVEIVGEQTIDGQLWYKIAPPAGEFRWIQARHVARADQPSVATPSADEVEPIAPLAPTLPPIVTVAATTESTVSDVAPVAQATQSQSAAQQEWRPAPADSMPTEVTAPRLPPDGDDSDAPTKAAESGGASTTPTARADAAAQQPSASIADGLARRLTALELQLSRIVAEPPATWQVEPLAREVEQLLTQAQTTDERKAVQTMIAKIDRFAAIGRQYRATSAGMDAMQPSQPPITPIADSRQPTADSLGYDAVGTLRPVVSKRPGAPQFALVNERGQVVSFVTPSPDVNLQPYVGHRIGITGSRGYIPEFQRAHVTAGRVAPLGQSMLR